MTKEEALGETGQAYEYSHTEVVPVDQALEAMEAYAKHCSELAFDAGSKYRAYVPGSCDIGENLSKQEFLNKHFPE